MDRIFWSRFRVRVARALLIAGRDIIEAEELRWGLVIEKTRIDPVNLSHAR